MKIAKNVSFYNVASGASYVFVSKYISSETRLHNTVVENRKKMSQLIFEFSRQNWQNVENSRRYFTLG